MNRRLMLACGGWPGPSVVALLIASMLLAACADSGEPLRQRRQITSCPPGEVLICESREPASKGGDEEILLYERCICQSAY